jgi:hypothetical protein
MNMLILLNWLFIYWGLMFEYSMIMIDYLRGLGNSPSEVIILVETSLGILLWLFHFFFFAWWRLVMQMLAVFQFMFDVMILSEVSMSLFLMVFNRFNLLMNVQLMMILELIMIVLLFFFLVLCMWVFLVAFLLMNLLGDINQMRGKQDIRVLLAKGIMAVIVGKGVNIGHWL